MGRRRPIRFQRCRDDLGNQAAAMFWSLVREGRLFIGGTTNRQAVRQWRIARRRWERVATRSREPQSRRGASGARCMTEDAMDDETDGCHRDDLRLTAVARRDHALDQDRLRWIAAAARALADADHAKRAASKDHFYAPRGDARATRARLSDAEAALDEAWADLRDALAEPARSDAAP